MSSKKIMLLLSAIISVNAMAGSIDYLAQQDAEYLATPAMVGKIGVSGAYYNPAGLVWLEDGTYMQVNNQTMLKKYSHEYGDSKFESDKPSAFIPSFQVVHKEGDTAYFFHAGAIGGGGAVDYNGGVGTFASMADGLKGAVIKKYGDKPIIVLKNVKYTGGTNVQGESYYVSVQGGIAHKLTKSWSGAVGVRLIKATRKFKGTGNFDLDIETPKGDIKKTTKFDIDSTREAYGVTGILGLNYHPNEKFNLGMRYETETKLDFDNKETNLKNGFIDSTNPRLGNMLYSMMLKNPAIKQWTEEGNGERNLPAMAAMGASYKATDRLTLLASGNYYFIKGTGDTVGNYKNYDNGYDLAVGLDYILNEKFTFMTGYQYTNTGANEKTYTDTDYPLDANMYSVGLKYNYSEQLQFIGAYSYVDYKPGTNKETQITYKKRVEAFGVSATYKF